ncbi:MULTISPECIES: methyl-accepting chemotaxis protein [Geobacter]|uniref:Chemotaxis protein n=2 Tax=Geobacter TaxID=28231 RepID=A0A0C1QM21_9BACT|nr:MULTISPECIES: methyl-accepting chemotaxis protein [Geobacter]KIE41697.1 chemotaxis protein [Geobacter soli]MBE2887389.1 methyl-accepting chemotaxis protein [Geobacter anodireducens]HMN03284.1 methyl-accepting chemotaxis protein [Geobacter anodireducens]
MKKSGAKPAEVTLHREIQRLAEAMMHGRLDERGDPAQFTGDDAALVLMVNRMLDTLVTPLRLAAGAIDEIAHGRIPPFVIDDYAGEYNNLKRNLNTLLATLYGLHSETQHLIGNIGEGRLQTRGNDWDFEGIWRDLIKGVNGTLDAVIDPVNEAGTVLRHLAEYDLSARMRGKYHGEHAAIKKAMNSTAESLHSAVTQMTETVELVSAVSGQIADSSQLVTQGAREQETQLTETSNVLDHIAATSQKSARSTIDARQAAGGSAESIKTAKSVMDQMLQAMGQIRSAADNTVGIVQQIDSIAKETDQLSSNATSKATLIRSSANGFSVVASEIRNLSKRCEDAVTRLHDFRRRATLTPNGESGDTGDALESEYLELIRELKSVASSSGLLGVNAAISAAHVEGAGNDFQALTEEIRQLARRSTDAARQTDTLIRTSVEQARRGEDLSRKIDVHLTEAVTGATTICALTEDISQSSQEQASAIEQISRSVNHITTITRQNADSALKSSEVSHKLGQQMTKLTSMVSKFRLDNAAC